MELIKIINARGVLETFAEKEDIGAKLSYWMTKFIAKTDSEYKFYITEMRKIYEKYSESDEEGRIIIPAEKVEEFNNAVVEIENTEVESPEIKFNLSDLASELKLSMKQMYALLDFIDEEK